MTATKPATRARHIWPEAAKRLVQKALRAGVPVKHASLLHAQLEEMTGFNAKVCWRFLERHGISRPKAGKYSQLDDPKILDFIMDRGYDLAAQHFNLTKRQLYNFAYRHQRQVGHTCNYSISQISRFLRVRPEVVHRWIAEGLLEATPLPAGSRSSVIVSDSQLLSFLKEYAGRLVPLRRFPEKRAQFLAKYLYDGKHMDLGILKTRESSKEGEAFRNGEYHPAIRSQRTVQAGYATRD